MKRLLKLLGSLAVTLVFGWWAFRDTHWAELWASLRSANYAWVLPYLAILLLIHLSRTARWGALLASQERVRFRALNDASAIGFMMLLVLPFRLGEFARPFLIAQRSSIRRSAAMTSVVLERIADGVFVALLLRGLLFVVQGEPTPLRLARYGANLMFAVFFGGFLFLLFAAWNHDRAVALVRGTLGRISPALGERASGIVDSFVGALKQGHRLSELAAFLVWTLVYWGLNGFGMWVLMQAFPFQLTLVQTYVAMCLLVVGVMIPAAPGMVGTFQAAVKLGLSIFLPASVVNGPGLAYANVIWLCQTTQQIGLGLIFLSVDQLSFRDLAGRLEREEDAPSTAS
ncbi:MAG TPA: lysylphosphatidylglycerol synthase transmembrane domain-containing protein [Myxococcaceae bacterium]|nr:lysylphosphatidylglycerol synthase transmembrane domain-containing protein [Myxococcaceae bacterium]